MKILARLLALFLIMPIVELALLLQVGDMIGFWPTLAIIIFTGVLGGYLAKREGLAVWGRFNERMRSGGLPGRELLDGIIILCAGALLITPGVLTDLAGLLGLIPFTRAIIRKQVMRRVERAVERGTMEVGFGGFGMGSAAPFEPKEEPSPHWGGAPQPTPRHAAEEDAEPPRG